MTLLQRAFAATKLFARSQEDQALIDWMSEHGRIGCNPLDDENFQEMFTAECRIEIDIAFEMRLIVLCAYFETGDEGFLRTINDAEPVTIDWEYGWSHSSVNPSARPLVEAHCANGVGAWYPTQEYEDGIMLHLSAHDALAVSIRSAAVGMVWRDGMGWCAE